MRRLTLRHDRDRQVIGDNHWNLMCVDTSDPLEDPVMVGWGSYEACRAFAAGLLDLAARTGLRP